MNLDADMTWHDAQMLHWQQWWKRHVRAGFAFAEGAWSEINRLSLIFSPSLTVMPLCDPC